MEVGKERDLLVMENISKSFPGVKALQNVSLSLRYGEVHALIGENGAGKSTLMKVLSGLYQADEGRIIWEGKELQVHSTRDSEQAGISIIVQTFLLLRHRQLCSRQTRRGIHDGASA